MSDKIEKVLQISLWKEKTISEIGPKSDHFVTEDGRKGFGNVCVLSSLSLDELKDLRDYIDMRLSERVKRPRR